MRFHSFPAGPRSVGLFALIALFSSAACSKTEEPKPTAPTPSASSVALTTIDASVLPLPTGAIPADVRIASEAKDRPKDTVTVEQTVAAFKAAGAEIREQKQHLGHPFRAKYCMGIQTGADIHMSICEYESAAKAVEGRGVSLQAFAAVPNRSIYANGGTTLTVRLGQNGPEDQALAKKLVATFEGLKPPPAK
jgi:hypothetical protein